MEWTPHDHVEPGLLFHLPNQGLLECLSLLDMPSGDLPLAGKWDGRGA
jgi:hypothetical protein